MTKIIIFGAGGRAGRAISREASSRGHDVTDVARDPSRHRDMTTLEGDITDPEQVAALAAGHDVAVHAAASVSDPNFFTKAASALLRGLRQAGVQRLVTVGLASNLPGADGIFLRDAPGYPNDYRDFYLAHEAGTDLIRGARDLQWTILAPAGDFDHDWTVKRRHRVTAAEPTLRISYPDFATAAVDEIENPQLAGTYSGLAW